MTVQQKTTIKEYVTIANLILLIGIIVAQARWQQTVDNRLERVEEHTKDVMAHPSFEWSSRIFVPRVEIDARLRGIEQSLIEIKSDLKKNLDK